MVVGNIRNGQNTNQMPHQQNSIRAVLIAGPTASGKSALALNLAQRIGLAWLINADSMQVYRNLRVLTARPTQAEEMLVPHRLFGTVAGTDPYSAARFIDDVRQVMSDAASVGALPIVVGGTGLYFKALLEGLSPIPTVPYDLRAHWRAEAHRIGAGALHRMLRDRDPIMAARLAATDTQRITRALEVVDATGRSLSAWQSEQGQPVVPEADTIRIVLAPERAALVQRCDARFDHMLNSGALEEVAALRDARMPPDLPIMRALGVRPLVDHIEGRIGLDEAGRLAKLETRQFAKRQMTWLNRKMIAWNWIKTHEIEDILAKIVINVKLS